MLDPDWALTRQLLWVALAALLAVLVLRAVRKDRREYQRFKRFRSTAKRQGMFRTWLRDAFLTFGGLSVGVLLLAGAQIAPLLGQLQVWPGLRQLRELIEAHGEIAAASILGLILALGVLTYVGVRAARRENDVVSIGDIQAMLPRNRQELRFGALLSINAGVFEELLFRLALPALVFGASGSALAAVIFSLLLFGALHLYQGVWGIVGTTVVGALMLGVYVVTGSIVWPIVLHVLFDLRTLVFIPMAVFGVHRVSTSSATDTSSTSAPSSTAAPTAPIVPSEK